MKVGILTLPLTNNYGAYLQNFALQTVLKNLGCIPVTIDILPSRPSLIRIICSCIKSIVFFPRSIKKNRFFSIELPQRRLYSFQKFLDEYISSTRKINLLNSSFIEKNNLNAVVVGSDQVWRPKYASNIENFFLKFIKKDEVLRVAYAVSFGVDNWEYSKKQTKICAELAKRFDAISVREKSGIKLCNDYLGVDATWVLDPTLLLKKDDYNELCKGVAVNTEKFLVAYVLDMNESVRLLCESAAKKYGLTIKMFQAGQEATLSVVDWIALFRDASYVVTDSFHGTVFSIIFGKEFKCIYNKSRGGARFDTLLNLYNSGKLDEMREFSIAWLKAALEN